jgi:CubicO group peptidase (beta-lactamase class C family)
MNRPTSVLHVLAAIVLLATPAVAAGPIIDQTGFDAFRYGVSLSYPIQGSSPTPPVAMVGFYSHYDQIRPLRPVPTALPVSPLERSDAPVAIAWTTAAGAPTTLQDYLERAPVTGLLIARGTTILYEHYRYGRTPEDRFLSQSMAKTLTGLLVGIAVSEGRIRSIDDPAAAYVSELAGTEYGKTPIRHLLRMSSGVAYHEDYSGDDDSAKLGRMIFPHNAGGAVTAVKQFDTRTAAPGARFYYAGAETEVLGLVVARAAGTSLSNYLSEKIWAPMGMEAPGGWAVDPTGQEIAFCCYVATLRDWARIGLMLADDGAWNGRQIVPRQWVIDSTTAGGATKTYGNQIWLLAPPANDPGRRVFSLIGIHGQRVYVDPRTKTVLVQTAVYLPATGPEIRESNLLWRALLDAPP